MKDTIFAKEASSTDNILDFSSTLSELRRNVDPTLVRHREGWRDRKGNARQVDYVEWHTVADILDRTAPNWNHAVKDIRTIGESVVITVAITIEGVTREGIGTGPMRSEIGIKKAEHDALKRAAVKFGIARDLYKRELDDHEPAQRPEPAASLFDNAAETVVSTNLLDMVSAKQLGMIFAIAREKDLIADEECRAMFGCKPAELNKKAASRFIEFLQSVSNEAASEARKAS